ncbi:MAG: carboxylate-amine ligase [Paracoccaceae bacterium]|nr:carboxylate-amine ligase [Paracoccaceae bacterium]
MIPEPSFTMGIEEEYLLVDPDTCELANAPQAMMDACAERLQGKFSPEFKMCQAEIGTGVSANITEAREDLRNLRATVAEVAGQFGLAPIAVSCHPFAKWTEQHHTDKERYNELQEAMGGVASRLLISGMHVHVGIDDKDMRIDLLNQLAYFLPHMLALSASSPYWQGQDTGLNCYRLTVFDNLPRTGLPPIFNSWAEYERTAGIIEHLGIIDNTTKIWWDLRPSHRFPTIESRICDVSPRMEDTLTLAAMTQCLTRMLWRLSRNNQRWRIYDQFLVSENRWRAQRFGVSAGLIDYGRREIVPVTELMEELQGLIGEDAEALGCVDEVARTLDIAANGNSADRQRAVYAASREAGASHEDALRAIVKSLIEEFTADL